MARPITIVSHLSHNLIPSIHPIRQDTQSIYNNRLRIPDITCTYVLESRKNEEAGSPKSDILFVLIYFLYFYYYFSLGVILAIYEVSRDHEMARVLQIVSTPRMEPVRYTTFTNERLSAFRLFPNHLLVQFSVNSIEVTECVLITKKYLSSSEHKLRELEA